MSFPEWTTGQENPEVPVNEGFDILNFAAVYGRDPDTTTGLTWGYLGGRWGGFAITGATLTLTNTATNYIVVLRSAGVISVSTSSTNWDNTTDYARVYQLTTAGGVVTATQDHRAGPGGVHGGGGGGGGSGGTAPLITEATSNRDVTPADAGSYIRFTGTGAKTCEFDVAEGFAAPEEYHVANRAASGNLTLTATGVTLNAPKGGTLVLEPGDTVTVKFVDTDEADVFGSTEPL
jgi:hypothetical protein